MSRAGVGREETQVIEGFCGREIFEESGDLAKRLMGGLNSFVESIS